MGQGWAKWVRGITEGTCCMLTCNQCCMLSEESLNSLLLKPALHYVFVNYNLNKNLTEETSKQLLFFIF